MQLGPDESKPVPARIGKFAQTICLLALLVGLLVDGLQRSSSTWRGILLGMTLMAGIQLIITLWSRPRSGDDDDETDPAPVDSPLPPNQSVKH